jgi:FkbM family methyltransferase
VGAVARRLGRPELIGALYRSVRRSEEDELAIRAVLAATLHADDVYVDVGSNRGQLLKEALRVAPQGRHIAFEPIPQLAAELAARFPALDRRQLALGAQEGTASFCYFTKLDGWSGLARNPEISDEAGAPEMIEVQVSTLDAQLPELAPAVVKVDVEGAELAVLEGGRSLLQRAHPLLIFEHVRPAAELYGASSERIWELLAEHGYRIFSATGSGPFARADFARAGAVVNWLAVPAG